MKLSRKIYAKLYGILPNYVNYIQNTLIAMEIDIVALNNELKKKDPFKRVEWARKQFGEGFCITSSFGAQSAIMAHIISKVDPTIPILFIDTGYHFSATIAYKNYLQQLFGLNIIAVEPEMNRVEFELKHNYPNENDTDFCCQQNKVVPLQKALKNYTCWGTGIRRTQTQHRGTTQFIANDGDTGRFKLAPIADYSDEEAEMHYQLYDLPQHPLLKQGYFSIGCDCCTQKSAEDDARSGRWKGEKTECGIHLIGGEGI